MTNTESLRLAAIEHRLAIAEERHRQADERASRLEEKIDSTGRRLERKFDDSFKDLGGKLDVLLKLAGMGRGAWWIITRLGVAVSALAWAFAWAADHFHWWQK